jgi:phosphoglycolate phosphatase
MNYKLVIFDFDGTLADSYPWFLSVFGDLAKRYRLPAVERADLEKLRALDIRQIQKDYKIPLWKVILIGSYLKKLMNSQIDKISLVSGMQTVIQTLVEQNVRLALVTSNAERNVHQVLGPLNLACFEFIESSVPFFGKKKTFEKILKKAGIPAHQALSIGDEVRDLKSAHDARISFGAVTWGYTGLKILQSHSPEEVFDHPNQILEAVNATQASPIIQGEVENPSS